MHIFINRLKVLLRSKSIIFWTLIFPIILGTLFNLAFSNLSSDEKFSPIKIGVVENTNYSKDTNFKTLINTTSKNNDDQLFKVSYYKDNNTAKKALENNEISGYYIVNKEIDIVVKNSGIDQTIMKSVLEGYYQNYSIINNIYKFNPKEFKLSIVSELNGTNNYFEDKSNKNIDITVIYFYTLIGMVCLYGSFFGNDIAKETEANLSTRAARVSIAPTHKLKNLLLSLLAGLVIQYIEVLILIAYLVFVLGINFGNQIPYILLLTFTGSIAGLSLGLLVGVSNKKSAELKTGILLAVSMTCSFLAGMMVVQMKYIIANNAPLLGKINPVSMITDGLYSLYYYDSLDRYFYNIFSLIIFSIVMITASYFFIRRKKYDSI